MGMGKEIRDPFEKDTFFFTEKRHHRQWKEFTVQILNSTRDEHEPAAAAATL